MGSIIPATPIEKAVAWIDGLREALRYMPASIPILVWWFPKAPPELRALAPTEDDVDWLALLPAEFTDALVKWCAPGEPWANGFGCCRIEAIRLPNQWQVRIGYHA